jgi:hypothetical protein
MNLNQLSITARLMSPEQLALLAQVVPAGQTIPATAAIP